MELYERYEELESCRWEIEEAVEMLKDSFQKGGKLLLCGNGGSCADCDHIVGELMKGFLLKRPVDLSERVYYDKDNARLFQDLQGALPAISLPAQTAVISAYGNDVSPNMAYAQMVFGYGKEGDVLLGISTSGNSVNVVNAVKVANMIGMKTIGLTGRKTGRMDSVCTLTVKVPAVETYRIQELHLPIYHYICKRLEEYFFHG